MKGAQHLSIRLIRKELAAGTNLKQFATTPCLLLCLFSGARGPHCFYFSTKFCMWHLQEPNEKETHQALKFPSHVFSRRWRKGSFSRTTTTTTTTTPKHQAQVGLRASVPFLRKELAATTHPFIFGCCRLKDDRCAVPFDSVQPKRTGGRHQPIVLGPEQHQQQVSLSASVPLLRKELAATTHPFFGCPPFHFWLLHVAG